MTNIPVVYIIFQGPIPTKHISSQWELEPKYSSISIGDVEGWANSLWLSRIQISLYTFAAVLRLLFYSAILSHPTNQNKMYHLRTILLFPIIEVYIAKYNISIACFLCITGRYDSARTYFVGLVIKSFPNLVTNIFSMAMKQLWKFRDFCAALLIFCISDLQSSIKRTFCI